MSFEHQWSFKSILISILFIGLASFIQWRLNSVVGEPSFIIFYPLVILASLYGNGWVAILFSALIIQYNFLPPQGQFLSKALPGMIKQIIFVTSSLMIHRLTAQLKWTLQQTQKMESRLQITLGSIGDGVISTDREGRVDFMNSAAEKITEWLWVDAVGRPLSEVLHWVNPVDRLPVDLLRESNGKGRFEGGLRGEILSIGKQGKETIIEDSFTAILSERSTESQSPEASQGWVLTFRDVSERFYKQKELEKVRKYLQESRDQFEKVLDHVLDGVIIIDASQHILLWNPQAEKMFGYSHEEVLSKPINEILKPTYLKHNSLSHPEKKEENSLLVDLQQVQGQRIEIQALRKDLSQIPLEVVLTPVQTLGGAFTFLFLKDLTLSRKAEHDLIEAHHKTDLILSSAAEGILGIDHEGRMMFVNPAAAQMLGWEESALIGESFSQKIHDLRGHQREGGTLCGDEKCVSDEAGQDGTKYDLSTDQSVREGKSSSRRGLCPIDWSLKAGVLSHREDEEFQRRDGCYFPVEYSSTPMKQGEKVVGLVLTFRDISERKKTEKQISDLMNQLTEALSSRDEFISIASHELKTPLTSLKLHYQLVARQLKVGDMRSLDPSNAVSRIESTNRQIDRMVRLIDDMLDVSRISSGRLELIYEEVNLSTLLRALIERYADDFKSACCSVSLDLEESLQCQCDSLRIEQVMANLLMNAFKYAAGKPIEIRLRGEEGLIVIEVQDHGMGISDEKKGQVFEKFERAISSQYISGFGLGLYISRKIVEAHHGKIMLESELGRGSCFIVKLPRKKRDEDHTRKAE